MAGRLQDKVAVVTGGCSGIGLATVRRFAEEGAKVVIADLNDDLGAQLAEELGGTYVHCNVASKEDVDNLFKVAHDTYGRIDIAFNNAGISPPEDDSILDTDLEAWDKVVARLSAENAFFKKVIDSQRAWVQRSVGFERVNTPSRDMAFNHFFGAS